MLDVIRKFRDLLDARERRNAVILFLMILVTGILEAVGVASVMPFLSVLSNPEVIQENAYLSFVYNNLGFSETNTFLFFLGIAVFLIVVFGLSFRALTEYFLARFTHMRDYSLSSRLLRSYLFRPYSWFLHRNSADLGKTLLSEVQQVIVQALVPITEVIAKGVITLCLIGMLIMIDPAVALVAASLLGGSYCIIYLFLRHFLSRIGVDRVKANKERFQIAQEAFGGIKEVKAAGLEQGYYRSFQQPARRFAKHQASNMIVGKLPRFVLQGLAFGGMLLVILVLLAVRGETLEQVLPTLGVFAFAGMRMLPVMQQVYQNATKLRYGTPALDALHADMMQSEPKSQAAIFTKRSGEVAPLHLHNHIKLTRVTYSYPGASQPAVNELDITIHANTTVGLAGATGAGKTTIVDIIMGLLTPDYGQILVDGHPIFESSSSARNLNTYNSLKSWQRSLGYVPQQIFLADDTVAANIAFGVPTQKIDMHAVERAASIAELHDFVLQELSNGYETTVGERGVRLSGGQRQRIGIARALYHDPDVLILDEATSALDNLTEKAVIDAMHNLNTEKTVIMIAHRLSTVQNCDQIFLLQHGRLIGRGTFSELLDTSQEFCRMAYMNE